MNPMELLNEVSYEIQLQQINNQEKNLRRKKLQINAMNRLMDQIKILRASEVYLIGEPYGHKPNSITTLEHALRVHEIDHLSEKLWPQHHNIVLLAPTYTEYSDSTKYIAKEVTYFFDVDKEKYAISLNINGTVSTEYYSSDEPLLNHLLTQIAKRKVIYHEAAQKFYKNGGECRGCSKSNETMQLTYYLDASDRRWSDPNLRYLYFLLCESCSVETEGKWWEKKPALDKRLWKECI